MEALASTSGTPLLRSSSPPRPGLFTSRADGAELMYNQEDVLLPDLLVCRPELAEQITGFVPRYWAENPPS